VAGPRPDRVLRVAVDTGGTFTDCVWIEDGRVRVRKVFSTPEDPARAILQALGEAVAGHDRLLLLHGTTVGTNTLLQRRGARLAFVTTEGFEDAIEIGRQARPRLYDFFFDRVPPLADGRHRFGVAERTAASGRILRRPGARELRRLVQTVARGQPEAIAVSLLFSFANPENERAVGRALKAIGVPISLSHLVLPEFREYERASTVLVNAYLQPVMQRYLQTLARRLGRIRPQPSGRTPASSAAKKTTQVFVMQSNGGIASLSSVAREPVRTILSGPAGGVVGAAAVARSGGYQRIAAGKIRTRPGAAGSRLRIISFDMGGTSTDVALVDGVPALSSEADVAGLPVRVPMLGIHTVGAGGGSVARFDAGGALRVGPESAGADPGPICYGRGLQPTVTDANLLLGRLLPHRFLGGEFILDPARTRSVVSHWLRAHRSPLSLRQFAAGVVEVVNANMNKAIRVVSVERGHDPRDFSLVAFGGAGGLHACELARALGLPRIIIPPFPGGLSAFGILVSDVTRDYSRTVVWRVPAAAGLPMERLGREFARLQARAHQDLGREGWRGRPRYRWSADLRYQGQGYELNVPYSPRLRQAFHREHQRRYGYSQSEKDVEIVTLRLRATLPSEVRDPRRPAGERLPARPPAEPARVYFDGGFVAAKAYRREALVPGQRYKGPAIVVEYSATSFIPPGESFYVDRAGNLVVELR